MPEDELEATEFKERLEHAAEEAVEAAEGHALAAVAALSRQKAVWFVGLFVGALGLIYFADGFWLYF